MNIVPIQQVQQHAIQQMQLSPSYLTHNFQEGFHLRMKDSSSGDGQ